MNFIPNDQVSRITHEYFPKSNALFLRAQECIDVLSDDVSFSKKTEVIWTGVQGVFFRAIENVVYFIESLFDYVYFAISGKWGKSFDHFKEVAYSMLVLVDTIFIAFKVAVSIFSVELSENLGSYDEEINKLNEEKENLMFIYGRNIINLTQVSKESALSKQQFINKAKEAVSYHEQNHEFLPEFLDTLQGIVDEQIQACDRMLVTRITATGSAITNTMWLLKKNVASLDKCCRLCKQANNHLIRVLREDLRQIYAKHNIDQRRSLRQGEIAYLASETRTQQLFYQTLNQRMLSMRVNTTFVQRALDAAN